MDYHTAWLQAIDLETFPSKSSTIFTGSVWILRRPVASEMVLNAWFCASGLSQLNQAIFLKKYLC